MSGGGDRSPDFPALECVRGNATPEEMHAVTVALLTTLRRAPAREPAGRRMRGVPTRPYLAPTSWRAAPGRQHRPLSVNAFAHKGG